MVEQEVLDCMKDIINTVVKRENNRIAVKKYREKNIEKVKQKQKEYQKQYRKTEQGVKTRRISLWKYNGLVCDNFDALYDHYTSTAYCDACRVELTYDKQNTSTTKCMDHCHETGLFRNILCHSCNTKRGQNNF